MDNILELKTIHKHFGGVHAVNNVSLNFSRSTVCALMGENGAGKSTLGKIVAGIYPPDEGQIIFNKAPIGNYSPHEAQRMGIGLVLQELDLFPSLSVANNIIINNIRFKKFEKNIMHSGAINKAVEPWLHKVGLSIHPSTPVEDLSMAQMQLVTIARVLSMDTQLIIMDEPTSSLTDDAVDNLFVLIKKLKKDGVTIIYVSHKMNEIFRISDSIAVMRDGRFIDCVETKKSNQKEIIEMMVGRAWSGKTRQVSHKKEKTILSVKNLNNQKLHDISFEVYEGEVLGIAGLVGAGRSELGCALFGLDPIIMGEIRIDNKLVKIKSPINAIRCGMGLIPEDRKLHGLMMQMSIKENIVLSGLDKLHLMGFLAEKKIRKTVDFFVESIQIKSPSMSRTIAVNTLSGGNQQKVLVSRWLAVNPQIIFLDDPTRGVDVGAKEDIYEIITNLASEGKGVIFVSSELPELLRCADRILVLAEGCVEKILDADETNQQEIMSYATRVHKIYGKKNANK